MFGSFTAPTAVFFEFEFFGMVDFVAFGQIVLSATNTTKKGD